MQNVSANLVKELREITGAAMMDCKKALVETNGDMEAAKDYLQKKGQAKALKKSSRETNEGAVGLYISPDKKRGGLVKLACETDFVARNDKFQDFIRKVARQVAEHGSENLLEQTMDGTTVQASLTQIIAGLGENILLVSSNNYAVQNGMVSGYVHTNGKIGVLVQLETNEVCDQDALYDLGKDISMHIAASHAEAISEAEIDPAVLEKEKSIYKEQAKESGKPDNIIDKMVEGRLSKFKKEVCVNSQPFVKNPELTVEQLIQNVSKELGVKITFKAFSKYQF
ncbi:MAG: translation elongation factor Ts [SAR324 cluster bacterium]|nr:translation elongation factor Ts [SAR324 cluster bacterium]